MAQPSAKNPVTLPADIWIHVAQFVSHTDLCSMFSINRLFFKLSMDARYRELTFNANSDPEESWRLQRARDPSIAHRVRHLSVRLPYLDDISVNMFNEEGEFNPGWIDISLCERIQIMTETVTFLTNVTEFSMYWEDTPPREQIVPFLVVAWKTFGSGLRKLSVTMALSGLVTLFSIADGPIALKDLDVSVCSRGSANDIHRDPLSTALAPFVNKAAPTLRSLSYFSRRFDVDSSPFFHRLENFPNLERLCLSIINNLDIIAEPFAATCFLCNHATTLRHLDWSGRYGNSGEQLVMDSLSGHNLEDAFSNLSTLGIRIPGIPDGLSMVVQRIRYSAQTLTSLALLDCFMTYEEVNTVISIFTTHHVGNLKELTLPVKFLSPEFVLLLRQTLPRLEKLTIHMKHLTGREADKRTPEPSFDGHHESRIREKNLNAAIFAEMMRTYDLHGWVLRDIQIEGHLYRELCKKLMWVLAECVPSVKTFCGKDKERCAIHYEDRL